MRKFILATSFCVLASMMCSTLLQIGRSQLKATCDGRKAVNIKCPIEMPADCFESLGCEADKEGHVGCYNAFAYNQDNFGCSAAQADPNGVPPTYSSLCLDSPNDVAECSLRKTCLAELRIRSENGMPVRYTVCKLGDTEWSYKHKKYTINDPECKSREATPTKDTKEISGDN